MKRLLVVAGVSAFALSVFTPVGVVFAHSGVDHEVATSETSTNIAEQKKQAQEKIEETRKEAQVTVESARKQAQEKVKSQRESIKEKLSTKRLEACNTREAKVNEINNKFASKAQAHLTRLAGATDKLTDVKTTKNLDVANYDTLLADVNAKATAAQVALTSVEAVDFNCDQEGVNREFGQYIKANIQTVRTAVKDYRDSIKSLAKAIRAAAEAQAQAAKPETETTPTTSTNTNGQ